MRIRILVLILCLAGPFASRAFAQSAKINLKVENASFQEAVNILQKESGYYFFYKSEDIPSDLKVTVNLKNTDINEVMSVLLNNTALSYKIVDTYIAIVKKDVQQKTETKQAFKITGTVRDKQGNTLPGVTVVLKGTSLGTITDIDGKYSLPIPENGLILVFSFIGMQTVEVAIGEQTTIDAILELQLVSLNELVVVGYGTASKRDLTGSIVKVSGKDVSNKPNANPIASLQGKVTGLSVVNNGIPGSSPDVRIRGTISLNQTSPLYVVDGIFSDNIYFVNPADIESIEVLKDPSSLAIFGVRGANGVIIISTKKGKEGQTIVNANFSFGVKTITDAPEMTDRNGFTALYDEQRFNQHLPAYSRYNLYPANTDWVSLIQKENAIVTNSNLSISNGTAKNKFYMGFGAHKEQGLIKYEDYSKINISISDELKVSKIFKIGFDISGYSASLPQTHSFTNTLKAPPIVEAFNEGEGLYNRLPEGLGGNDVGNPLQQVEENKYTSFATEYNIAGSTFAEIIFLEKLTFRANLYTNLFSKDFRNYTPLSISYNQETNKADTSNAITSVYQDRYSANKFQQDYLLSYKNQIGEHGITVLGGITTYFENNNDLNGSVKQYIGGDPIPKESKWWYVNVFPYGDPESRNVYSSQSERATLSGLFRALYNYKGKYMLNASFRRDGSSAISPAHRFQNFWAIGGAWALTDEEFMKSQKFFNNIKIKASTGQLGNQYTGLSYPYYPNYQNGTIAVFGNNIVPAYVLAYRNDPNLKWETVDASEGGFDLDAINSKLHVEANYYSRKTRDLLTFVNDGSENFYTNAGSVKSSGFEFLASWNNSAANGINYNASANITTIKSEVLKVWKPGYVYTSGSTGQSRTEVGYPIGYFYGYVVEGLDNKGNFRFKDVNKDLVITSEDRTMIGNPTPKFTYGFTASSSYKGFDVSMDLQGVYGNQVWRNWGNEGAGSNVYNFRTARLGRWTGEGTSDWEPQENTTAAINSENSTYMIEDGSYMRIRNIQLGYTLSSGMLANAHIRSMRFYISGQNLKTWKHNSGFTPEAGGGALEFGVDNGGYPVPIITSTGFNLTF
jgi:TonB-linked SusC/RagA family outer membrane protein